MLSLRPFALAFLAPAITLVAGCSGSAIGTPVADLSSAAPDLTAPVDLAFVVDLTVPPDLYQVSDLVSLADLSTKIFFSGHTFSNTAPPQAAVTLPPVGNGNYPNVPPGDAQLVVNVTIGPLYSTYVPNGPAFGATQFKLLCDAGTDLGQATQLELVYDFNGDGTSVRTEIYKLFPTDPVPGWEAYTDANGLWSQKGGFANFAGGTLTARLWKTFQPKAAYSSAYQEGTSYLLLPYR